MEYIHAGANIFVCMIMYVFVQLLYICMVASCAATSIGRLEM